MLLTTARPTNRESMATSVSARVYVTNALLAACLLTGPPDAVAAAVLRSADIRISVTSPTSCEVTMAMTVEGGSEIDHRVEAFDGAGFDLMTIRDARQIRDPRAIGRTRSLVLRLDRPTYEFRYGVRQPEGRAYRCPLWLPAVPTDGQSRAVRLQIELPPATTPGSSFPAFTWSGTRGSTTLGHVPAFVRVAYGSQGEESGWDVGRVMDVAAIAVFVVASAWWVWRRRS
jgi:hypothetical protein